MRKIIALAVFLAGLLVTMAPPAPTYLNAGAFAAPPPAVPAEPDTERRTRYTATAQTGPFAVGFDLYGDSTDYANWLKVYLNGVEITQSGNWTLSSVTGSLSTIARPITDATITFTAAQTGTVDIVGTRRPRRTSQFNESAGIPARNHNQVLTDIITMQREGWDRDLRSIMAPPGETMGQLASAATRAGKLFVWDGSGNPSTTSSATGLGNVLGPGSSTVGNFARWNNITGTLLKDGGAQIVTADYTNNSVTNAKLSTAAANTVKCNPTTSTATPTDCTYPTLNVKDYGAICNGSGDDSAAINSAIAALPVGGGVVEFPNATCRITSTISIGNGNSTPTASTRWGVILRGLGNPLEIFQPVFGSPTTPRLLWAGGGAPIIKVNGPLNGWGVQNLVLDCASIANSVGVEVATGVFGDSRNLKVLDCFRGVLEHSYVGIGSFHNAWYNTSIRVPAISGAIGIILTGNSTDNTSNTSFSTWFNTSVSLPGTLATYGIYLQVTDTDNFYATHIAGGNALSTGISFDYTGTGVSSTFPDSVQFHGLENALGGGGTSFSNGGTPGAASANVIYGMALGNGATCPLLANLACFSPKHAIPNVGGNTVGHNYLGAWETYTPTLSCQTGSGTFTGQSGHYVVEGKKVTVTAAWTISAIGTCAAATQFTLPVTADASIRHTGEIVSASAGTFGGCSTDTGTPTRAVCYLAPAAQSFTATITYEIP